MSAALPKKHNDLFSGIFGEEFDHALALARRNQSRLLEKIGKHGLSP